MFARIVLVVLLCLNLATLAWWAWPARTAPDVAVRALPAGVVRLQLAAAPRSAGMPTDAALPPATTPSCVALGPFANATATQAALLQLRANGLSATPKQLQASVRGYRVEIPPLPSVEAAQAAVAQLKAAGVNDLFVMRDGPSVNGIALGRFDTQTAAERRVAELAAKGVNARSVPAGSGPMRFWLEVAASQATAQQWQAQLQLRQLRATPCSTSR